MKQEQSVKIEGPRKKWYEEIKEAVKSRAIRWQEMKKYKEVDGLEENMEKNHLNGLGRHI